MTDAELLKKLRNHQNVYESMIAGEDPLYLYEFSEIRCNLLEWYDFAENSSVVQLGCGYGSLTELFAKKAGHVINIVSDPVKYEINKIRYENRDNIEVRCIPFDAVELDEKADYVYLELSEECVGDWLESGVKTADLLRKAKTLLKKDGTLIFVLNNKMGLSFMSGEKDLMEKHYLADMVSLKSFPCRLSKKEAEDLLVRNQFVVQNFFYPMPGYRFPDVIYSDGYLPHQGEFYRLGYGYGQKRYRFFREDEMFEQICKNGCFDKFANSFLIFARA